MLNRFGSPFAGTTAQRERVRAALYYNRKRRLRQTGGGVIPPEPDPNFDPVDYLGDDLIEYWDANRADTIGSYTDQTYTDAVNLWTGLKTGAPLVQSTPNLKPTYSPTGLAGGPCIQFDGTQQYLTCTDSGFLALLPSGADPCELWALCSQDALVADTTTRHVVGYAQSSLTNGRSLARVVTSGANRAREYVGTGGAASTISDTTVDLSGVHVMRGIIGATQSSLQTDGGTLVNGTVTPVTGTPALFVVGAIPALAKSNWWKGSVAAVLVTKPLSTDQATALHNYFG